MNFKLFFIFWFLGSFFCFSQIDSTKVAFVAYWSKGDSYDFKITKINKQWEEEKISNQDSTTYFANFTVIDSTANEYKINWKYKANFTNLPLQIGELLNNNNIILDFKYKTNELGEFLEVENWEEISDLMEAKFNLAMTTQLMKNPKMDTAKFQNAIQPFMNVFTSKEGIEMFILKELQYFHFPLGVEFNPKESLIYEEEFSNLLNGDPLRGNGKISFEAVDYENSFCIFNQNVKINSEDAKEMIIQLFDQMGVKKGEFMDKFKSSKFDITDNNYFEYFYSPGIPYYIETSRSAELDIGEIKNKRIEIIRIELILKD